MASPNPPQTNSGVPGSIGRYTVPEFMDRPLDYPSSS